MKRLATLFRFCEATTSLNWIFLFLFFFSLSLFLLPAHGFATAQPTKYLTDWAQREGADQPLNTDPVCLLFASHFCQVWQPIRLK